MAYGISVTGSNNAFVIDSNTTQTEYLSVISSGTVNGTNNSRATITATPPDIVLMNKPTVSASDGAAGLLRNGYNTTNVTTKYIVARKTASLSSYTGTYGLQIKNNSNVVIFDSRAITEGINIIDIKPTGTVMGARMSSGVPGPDTVEKDDVDYPTVIYYGDPTNVYVSTYGAAFYSYGQNYWMQYHFDYVNNEITLMHSSNYLWSGIEHYRSWAPIYIGKLLT